MAVPFRCSKSSNLLYQFNRLSQKPFIFSPFSEGAVMVALRAVVPNTAVRVAAATDLYALWLVEIGHVVHTAEDTPHIYDETTSG
jgi:hypothetical protein